MLVKVFVLGRPGSGKTTAIHHLTEVARQRQYTAQCLDDYTILQRMSREQCYQDQFRATAYGGFDVLDVVAYDRALEQLEQQVQQEGSNAQDGIIAIEFARNDYRHALQCFSPAFLTDSYFLFMRADPTTCIQRIHQRIQNEPCADNHFVSDYIMQTYYSKDDWMQVQERLTSEETSHKEVLTLSNTSTLQRLLADVDAFAERLFQAEFSVQPVSHEQQEVVLSSASTSSQEILLPQTLPQLALC